MTTDLFDDGEPVEDLADGGTWLLDLIAAVDHLRRGYRPDFTVWNALNEAVEWRLAEAEGTDSAVALSVTARDLASEQAQMPTPAALQVAVRRWVTTMAARYNNGRHWPHPSPRRGFPPPLLATDCA